MKKKRKTKKMIKSKVSVEMYREREKIRERDFKNCVNIYTDR